MSDCSMYNSVIPSLVMKNANKAIEFYKKVFNAKEIYRLDYDNKIMHAEIQIGNTVIMLSDEMGDWKFETEGKKLPFALYIYVDNVDKVFNKAIEMGAKVHYPIQTHFYGDRMGSVIDPFGYMWDIATHVEDVPDDEIKRRLPNVIKQMKQQGGNKDYRKKYIKYKQKYFNIKKQN
ncbi:glyoxalase [Tupanvirus soda lake]|uniref:Glyoxalase n=2 Tax=Tupanvirus TaxID=2094720 RepID=A0A6N1NVC6_9VIRU|nr:glyoxalase [Tupanvirus soda lake]QKU35303.1 glyoxalase [Tupanvirus soda lake]